MFQTFEEYLTYSSTQIPLLEFVMNLLLTALFALILAKIYEQFGSSLSNRKLFGRNFLLVSMTTMLIISVVKSSLALSLGLVGALSIIRFRAAIKEPEELGYIFFVIAIGLGFGANQGVITTIAFCIMSIIIIGAKKIIGEGIYVSPNLYLTINTQQPEKINLDQILEILKLYCFEVNLIRLDENVDTIEISFLVKFNDFEKLNESKKALQKLDKTLSFSFFENKGIY